MRLLLIWLIAKIPAMVVPATVVPATRLDSLDSEIARLQSLLRRKTREAAVLRAVSNSASGGLHAASDPASDGRRELQPFNPPEEQTTLSYTPEYKPTGGGDVESAPEMCALHNLMYCFGNDFYLARGKVAWTPSAPLHEYSHVVANDDAAADCVVGGTGEDTCKLPASWALRVNAIDVDRDGQLDLVVGTQYFLGLSANNGIEVDEPRSFDVTPDDDGNQFYARAGTAVCDVDGDGAFDLVGWGYVGGARALMWAENAGDNEHFTTAVPVDATSGAFYDPGEAARLVCGDYDSDGLADVVASNDEGSGGLELWLQRGGGDGGGVQFTKFAAHSSDNPIGYAMYNSGDGSCVSPTLADWDGDGDNDLFVVAKDGIVLLEKLADGDIYKHATTAVDGITTGFDVSERTDEQYPLCDDHPTLTVLDWDNSGTMDVLLCSYQSVTDSAYSIQVSDTFACMYHESRRRGASYADGDEADSLFTERTGAASPLYGVTTSDQFICDDGIGTCTYDGDTYDDEMDDYYYDGGGHYGNPYSYDFDAYGHGGYYDGGANNYYDGCEGSVMSCDTGVLVYLTDCDDWECGTCGSSVVDPDFADFGYTGDGWDCFQGYMDTPPEAGYYSMFCADDSATIATVIYHGQDTSCSDVVQTYPDNCMYVCDRRKLYKDDNDSGNTRRRALSAAAEQEAEQAKAQAPLPTIADVDSDGDLDLVVFGDAGGVQFIEQLDNGTFAQRTGSENPLSFLDEIYCSETALPDQSLTYRTCQSGGQYEVYPGGVSLAFGDVDGDGDNDLVIGEWSVTRYFAREADGTYTEHASGSSDYPFDGVTEPGGLVGGVPVLADFNDDGRLDLALFGWTCPEGTTTFGGRQRTWFCEESAGTWDPDYAIEPLYRDVAWFTQQTDGYFAKVDSRAAPPSDSLPDFPFALIDLDGDGDLDLVTGAIQDDYTPGISPFSGEIDDFDGWDIVYYENAFTYTRETCTDRPTSAGSAWSLEDSDDDDAVTCASFDDMTLECDSHTGETYGFGAVNDMCCACDGGKITYETIKLSDAADDDGCEGAWAGGAGCALIMNSLSDPAASITVASVGFKAMVEPDFRDGEDLSCPSYCLTVQLALNGRCIDDNSTAYTCNGNLGMLSLDVSPVFTVGDLDGDGDVDVVTGNGNLAGAMSVFTNGLCTADVPCNNVGLCLTSQMPIPQCTCLTGFAGTQCETCAESFFGADCDVCPGGGSKIAPNLGNVCSVRGVCDDASHEAGGECTCNEHFNGTDCDSGSCPLGLVEELAETRLRQCATCPAGKAAAAGARECTACAASRFIDRSEDSNWRYGGECVESTDGDASCSANCCQASSNVFDARDGGVCRRCVKESDGSSGCLGLGNSASDDAAAWTLATMVLRSGFWRKSATTLHVVECAHPSWCTPAPDRVPNGTYFGDYLCREGHTGPFCAMCLDARGAEAAGYGSTAYTMAADGCVECDGTNVLTDPKALGLLLAAVLVPLLALTISKKLRDIVCKHADSALEKLARGGELSTTALEGVAKEAADGIEKELETEAEALAEKKLCGLLVSARSKIKICISFYQVASMLPFVLPAIELPDLYVWATDALRTINISFADLLPFGCLVKYDYLDRLVSLTLFPFALAALFVARFAIAARTKDEKAKRDARDKRDSWLLLLSYLVCASSPPHDRVFCSRVSHVPPPLSRRISLSRADPSCSSAIFNALNSCEKIEIDADSENLADWRVRVDLGMACANGVEHWYDAPEPRYDALRAYAIVMTLVYPIGAGSARRACGGGYIFLKRIFPLVAAHRRAASIHGPTLPIACAHQPPATRRPPAAIGASVGRDYALRRPPGLPRRPAHRR